MADKAVKNLSDDSRERDEQCLDSGMQQGRTYDSIDSIEDLSALSKPSKEKNGHTSPTGPRAAKPFAVQQLFLCLI